MIEIAKKKEIEPIPECKYEFLGVALAGIIKKPNGRYGITIIQPEFIEKEIPEFSAKNREKPPIHSIHVLEIMRDKIAEVFETELHYLRAKHEETGNVPAEVQEVEKEKVIRSVEDIPVRLISENVQEELKIAQSLDFGPADKRAR